MGARVRMRRGSSNVFSDVGFPRAEAENLVLRAQSSSVRTME